MTGRCYRTAALLLILLASVSSCDHASESQGQDAGSSARAARGSPSSKAAEFSRSFVDITRASGIDFRHVTGGYGEKLLPETLGSGVAFLDFDNDLVLDLFFVNSTYWPGHPPAADASTACALYRGRGDGTFVDVTEPTGAGITLYGMGCAVADYDGDGHRDIYVTALGDNVLLRNEGGRFRDVTRGAGVAGGRWEDPQGRRHPEWSTAAVWADLERDGDLDLFVANYVEWTPEGEIFTTFDGHTKIFTTPDAYRGLPCRLFVNRGDGSFEDASEAAGLSGHEGKALGIALWDFDDNGFLDVAVANDTRPNFLFLNHPTLRLEEAALELGIAYDENGRARAGMGIDVADCARDGVPMIAIGNFGNEPMSLYRWNDGADCRPYEHAAGVAQPTFNPLAFGVAFLDLDLDGIEDLVIVNGHLEPEIERFQSSQSYQQSAQVFQGLGDGTFRDVSRAAGRDFMRPRVGRGLASGDVDGDGDLDLVVTQNGGAPVLLRNDEGKSRAHHFLRVRLRGRGQNTDALGATVRLEANGVVQTRLARTGSSYLSQSEPTLTFGLGPAQTVERLTVTWPTGETRDYFVTAVDRTIEIREE